MPKDPHITGGIRHDWAAIKHYYVTDPNATLRKAAKKYGVSLNTIAKKSKAENWFATRKEHQTEVVTKAITRTGNLQAKELADEAVFLALMKGHMGKMLSDEQQFQRHIVEEVSVSKEDGRLISTSEAVFEKFDTRAMKDAMQTLKMIEEMARSMYNIQKATEIQKHQLDADRLKLDQERFEFEKQKAEMFKPSEGNAIRIEGFEKGWSE